MSSSSTDRSELKWDLKKAEWRGFELAFAGAMYVWGAVFPDPTVLEGPGAVRKLPHIIRKQGNRKVLVITGPHINRRGLNQTLYEALKTENIDYAVYDQVRANPTVENVEEALRAFREEGCDAIIACGGGSPMDTAKAVMARAARPGKSVRQMKGAMQVSLPSRSMNGFFPPALYAIPTTAGTGSETTIAAVITDAQTHDKFPIMDPLIRANCAVLDPELTTGLPPAVTAATGLDALTHAVEGYTNIWYNNRTFNDYGREAVRLIFENLETAYRSPNDLNARGKMLRASYDAGMCFTRGGVGYVHGIGHRLGGLYGIPHGLAMAVILPYVFADDFLGPYVTDELAELADTVGIRAVNKKAKAETFLARIRAMEDRMDIPTGFRQIRDEDIPLIAERCMDEVNPTYPVKHIFTQAELEEFIRRHLQIK